MKKFPVLESARPKRYVNWDCLDEAWAYKLHDQSLERLASRGGLSPKELVLNVAKRVGKEVRLITDDEAELLLQKIQINE
jgi:hypothetical protein